MKIIDKRTKNKPKISIIMSIYNAENTLEKSLNSIFSQSFKDYEVIIINDGSKDKSEAVIKKFLKKKNNILFVNSKKNYGLATMLNKGIKYSRSNFIVRQDSDDISKKDRLKKQYIFLLRNYDIDVLGTNSIDFHENNKKIKKTNLPISSNYIKKNLINKNFLIHSSTMIRKSFFLKNGFYNENFTKCQDYELWLRGRHNFKYKNLKYFLIQRNVNKKKFGIKDLFLSSYAKFLHSKSVKDYSVSFLSSTRDLVLYIYNFFKLF